MLLQVINLGTGQSKSPVSPDAIIAEEDWEDCSFSSASDSYRRPKSGSFIAGGVTAEVFW